MPLRRRLRMLLRRQELLRQERLLWRILRLLWLLRRILRLLWRILRLLWRKLRLLRCILLRFVRRGSGGQLPDSFLQERIVEVRLALLNIEVLDPLVPRNGRSCRHRRLDKRRGNGWSKHEGHALDLHRVPEGSRVRGLARDGSEPDPRRLLQERVAGPHRELFLQLPDLVHLEDAMWQQRPLLRQPQIMRHRVAIDQPEGGPRLQHPAIQDLLPKAAGGGRRHSRVASNVVVDRLEGSSPALPRLSVPSLLQVVDDDVPQAFRNFHANHLLEENDAERNLPPTSCGAVAASVEDSC
mmetsp:Transcript_71189/g.231279  ORF Transcript_71189/g.231279 Transcript_71189/m.231279 type:complete len:297 (-) Transcript_71189:731-1621(-)